MSRATRVVSGQTCMKSATKEAPKPKPTIIMGTSPGWITPEGTKKRYRHRYSEVTPATQRVLLCCVLEEKEKWTRAGGLGCGMSDWNGQHIRGDVHVQDGSERAPVEAYDEGLHVPTPATPNVSRSGTILC